MRRLKKDTVIRKTKKNKYICMNCRHKYESGKTLCKVRCPECKSVDYRLIK